MRVLINPSNWRDPGSPAGRAGMVEPDVFLRHSLREQARLPRENAELRQACADLTAAAETWIRLYEAALARANAAEAIVAELTDRTRRMDRAS